MSPIARLPEAARNQRTRPARSGLLALALIASAALVPMPAQAQFGIERIPVNNARQLLAGDLDGYGSNELLAIGAGGASPGASSVLVFQKQGADWVQIDSFDLVDGDAARRAQLLRRYGDSGPLDLVIQAYEGATPGLAVYENDGAGHFPSAPLFVPIMEERTVNMPGSVYADSAVTSIDRYVVFGSWLGGYDTAALLYFKLPLRPGTPMHRESTPGRSAFHVAITDFDDDGMLDMWLSGRIQRGPNEWPAGSAVRFGAGGNIFSWGSWGDPGVGMNGGDARNAPAVVDLNGDGKMDVIAGLGDEFQANPAQYGGAYWHQADVPTSFIGALYGPRMRYALDYRWGDVNGDGSADLVTLALGRATGGPPLTADSLGFAVYLGSSGGSYFGGFDGSDNLVYDIWNVPGQNVGEGFDIALADLAGDPSLDVAMLTPDAIQVIQGYGDGRFDANAAGRQGMQLAIPDASGRVLGIADLDESGANDVIVGAQSAVASLAMISVDTLTSQFVLRDTLYAGPVVTHLGFGRLYDPLWRIEAILGRDTQKLARAGFDTELWIDDTGFYDFNSGSGNGSLRGLAVTDFNGDTYDDVVTTVASPLPIGDHFEVQPFDPWTGYVPLPEPFERTTGVTGCAVGPWNANLTAPSLIALFDGTMAVEMAHGIQYGPDSGHTSSEPLAIAPRPASPHPFEVAQLRGAGQPYDIVVAMAGSNSIQVLVGTGPNTGLWTDGTNYPVAGEPVAVAVGDLNSDTRPDVAVACVNPNALTIYLTDSFGALTGRTDCTILINAPLVDVRIGDITGDPAPEVVFLSEASVASVRPAHAGAALAAGESQLMSLGFGTTLPAVVGVDDSNGPGANVAHVDLTIAPNPVASTARLEFALPVAGHARIDVFDVSGRRVATLADADFPAGRHSLRLTDATLGAAHANGVFFARLRTPAGHLTRRLVVMH